MNRPKKEDYIKENMHLTTSYSLAQDKYIDYLEEQDKTSSEQISKSIIRGLELEGENVKLVFENKALNELVKTLQKHIKISN